MHSPLVQDDLQQKEAYEQKMAAQLQLWDIRIRKLEARGIERNVHTIRHARGLRRKMDEARGTLSVMRTTNDRGWPSLRERTERLWREMEQAVNGLQRSFS